MKYLFLDLEFATTRNDKIRICEIGYIQTDENYNTIKSGEMIINPNIEKDEWDWWVVKNMLTRKKRVYLNSEIFSYYYNDLMNLISESDYIFGHGVREDLLGLKQEPERYGKSPIVYTCYDTQILYMKLKQEDKPRKLETIVEIEGVARDNNYHNAKADAFNVMSLLKFLLKKYHLSINDLLSQIPEARKDS